MRAFRFSFGPALLMLLLSACPGSSGGGLGLSGTVTAPAGGDVSGTVINACPNGVCDQQAIQVAVDGSGPSGTFNIPNAVLGIQYQLFAGKDVDNNGSFQDAADYSGQSTLVTAPAANISIVMTGGANAPAPGPGPAPGPAPGPNPTPTPGGGLSGTVFAPSGGDISGTIVVACFAENGTCNLDSPNTQATTISTSGANATFTFASVADGIYAVEALKDVNGNESFDAGDYYGCYGQDGTSCQAARPGDSNLTIQMQVEGGSGGGSTLGKVTGTLVFPGDGASVPASQLVNAALNPVAGQSLDTRKLRRQPATLSTARANDIIPGEVIVRFKPQLSLQEGQAAPLDTAALNAKLGGYQFRGASVNVVRALALRNTGLYRVAGLSVQETVELAQELSVQSDVLYAEPNAMRYALKTPDDEFYGIQWHYPVLNLPNAWDVEDGTSSPVTVAVIDSGGYNHPDMAGVFVGGYDFVSPTEISGDGDGRDADPTDLGQGSGYHGLHVAGTVAAATNNSSGLAGVSWGAKVVPVRALGVTGGGTLADIVDGTLWAGGVSVSGVPDNPNPAKVLNLSLGGTAPCSATEDAAFQQLKDAGVVVVVAAGNENQDAGFSSPANCSNVITVGATGPRNNRAPYSNFGDSIDVMAPGGDLSQSIEFNGETWQAGVWSTMADDSGDTFYSAYQGTSMAAPHVAGVVALMLSRDPSLTPDSVLTRLTDSATLLDSAACGGETCGAGLIDAAEALSGTGTGPTPGPPDGPPPPPTTGQVQTFVAALYCTSSACTEFDLDRSGEAFIDTAGLQIPFEIPDLETGAYVVAAWQDLNENVEIDEGEPFGSHLNNIMVAEGETVDRVDIYLQPARVSAGVSAPVNAAFERAALRFEAGLRVIPAPKDELGDLLD